MLIEVLERLLPGGVCVCGIAVPIFARMIPVIPATSEGVGRADLVEHVVIGLRHIGPDHARIADEAEQQTPQ